MGSHIREAEGFLLVYSIASRESFEETVTAYQQILRCKRKGRFSAILLANKCDLEHEREVGLHGMSLSPHSVPLTKLRPLLTSVAHQRVRTLPDTWDAHSLRHPQGNAPMWMRHLLALSVKFANGYGHPSTWGGFEIDFFHFRNPLIR
jgi:hypothetical protein